MAEIKMVVGLGNPGEEYVGTRHNLGFCVVDSLAKLLDVKVKKRKFGGLFGEVEFANKKLILLRPCCYMNLSGQVVATAAGFYKLDVSDLLIVTDDMALPPGKIRIRMKGSCGGHNGLLDVIEKLGTEDIRRLRVGIGPSGRVPGEKYVLGRPPEAEGPLLDEAVDRAKEAALCWVEYGIESAMNKFNE